ncbi:MAG TPA: ABC transporter permease [Bacteroidia bacterium]|nr:ABC transporter permease [Bacteroidia bacterium]HRH09104.1 ABC transporter permease [Bacteroidia bacterium]HRH62323.1 ABC transporter permease [Bacteroidia bacterium]
MYKLGLIIKREYLARVKNKSFILMSILGPLLMAGLIFARVWMEKAPNEHQKIQVIDNSGLFSGKLENNANSSFYFCDMNLKRAMQEFYKTDYNALLFIPENILISNRIEIYYKKQLGISAEEVLKNTFKNKIEDWKLISSGIDKNKLSSVKTSIILNATKLEESGEQKRSNAGINAAMGFMGAVFVYLFIFLYGAQVMRGVIEEKTNRIVEVIISSVKPFELMLGKIVGIALLGLTQFLLWILLTTAITTYSMKYFTQNKYDATTITEQTFKTNIPVSAKKDFKEINESEVAILLNSVNFPVMIAAFIFYFLGGYLLYAALFAAIGAAVDSESDTQQFMLPITIPLILSLTAAKVIMSNPDSSLSFWLSIFPLTSPVIMMVRIAYGVPAFELILSMLLLILGFFATTWLSAKIYRTGILLYGKKASYKEIWKWLFYKA